MHTVLEQLKREFGSALDGLSAAETQLRTSNDPARWSIQQIVEHLLLTYRLSADVFEQRIAKGTATKTRPSVGQWLGQVVVLRLGRFPQGRAAPAMVMPRETPDELLAGSELVRQTGESLRRFDVLAEKAETLFGDRRSITHPILGPLTVAGWRRFHLIHGEHHLKQIEAIRSGHAVSTARVA